MKYTPLSIASVSLFATAAVAVADFEYDPALDVVIDLGTVSPTSMPSFQGPSVDDVVGWSFSGVWSGGGNPANTELVIYLNGSEVLWTLGAMWDFEGESGAGFYAHGVGGDQWGGDGLPDWGIKGLSGDWSFDFFDFSFSGATWSDAQIILHRNTLPAPAALAVLGLAALGGVPRNRQRRR